MKHSECFKDYKATSPRAYKPLGGLLSRYLVVALTCCLLLSCVKHDEIEFKGELVDVRFCASSSEMRNQGAYFVRLDTPEDQGKSYTSLSGEHYENVVMLFDPGCRIYKGDKLSGAFYLDKNYGRANCGSWSDVDVPEGVFTSVSVD